MGQSDIYEVRELNVVCIFDTFNCKLEIKIQFTKYLKENCWFCSDQYFSFIPFHNYTFA